MRSARHQGSNPSVLLITNEARFARSIEEAVGSIDNLDLEVRGDLADADAIDPNGRVAILLIHLPSPDDGEAVLALLGRLREARSTLATLVLLDEHDANLTLALLRAGVFDCLSRPLDMGRLAYLMEMLTLETRFKAGRQVGLGRPGRGTGPGDPEASAPEPGSKMGRLMEQVRRIAPQDSTVLLGGETGTGKTRLAGQIHKLSPRSDKPFLVINCGALSATLIESEMFGHARGAFTGADVARVGKFAEVGKGTLFLDEVDSLPLALQAKLLRVVEERVFEPVGSNKSQPMQARLIAASNRPLDREVAAGRFRADLFYRLNVISFELPPLRDRVELVAPLARQLLAEFAERTGRDVIDFTPEAIAALQAHDWPGNVREFRNTIERAVALGSGSLVEIEDLPDALQTIPEPTFVRNRIHVDMGAISRVPESLSLAKETAERSRISQALTLHSNNRLRAAAELGISRMTLYNKLRKYDLT